MRDEINLGARDQFAETQREVGCLLVPEDGGISLPCKLNAITATQMLIRREKIAEIKKAKNSLNAPKPFQPRLPRSQELIWKAYEELVV